jgi:hypothetical protein
VTNAKASQALAEQALKKHQDKLQDIKRNNGAPIPDRVQDLEDDVTEEKKKAHAEEQNLEIAQRVEEKLKDEKDKAERDAKDKKKEGKQEWEKNEHHFHNK